MSATDLQRCSWCRCAMGQCYESDQLNMRSSAIRCYRRALANDDLEGAHHSFVDCDWSHTCQLRHPAACLFEIFAGAMKQAGQDCRLTSDDLVQALRRTSWQGCMRRKGTWRLQRTTTRRTWRASMLKTQQAPMPWMLWCSLPHGTRWAGAGAGIKSF